MHRDVYTVSVINTCSITIYQILKVPFVVMPLFGAFYVNSMRSGGSAPSVAQYSSLTTFTDILGGPEGKAIHLVVLHEFVERRQCVSVLNHVSYNGHCVQK